MARQSVITLEDITSIGNLFDIRPFRDCNRCNGLCFVLTTESSVRQLLEGQRVAIFQGQLSQLQSASTRGCQFAKLLDYLLSRHREGSNVLDVALQRVDKENLGDLLLLSLLEGEGRKCYLEVVTGPVS
jgi:hypothetical protein